MMNLKLNDLNCVCLRRSKIIQSTVYGINVLSTYIMNVEIQNSLNW